jgi:hypothetical protein
MGARDDGGDGRRVPSLPRPIAGGISAELIEQNRAALAALADAYRTQMPREILDALEGRAALDWSPSLIERPTERQSLHRRRSPEPSMPGGPRSQARQAADRSRQVTERAGRRRSMLEQLAAHDKGRDALSLLTPREREVFPFLYDPAAVIADCLHISPSRARGLRAEVRRKLVKAGINIPTIRA